MDGVRFETESHQYGFDAQHLFERRDDGNTSSASHSQRLFAESNLESFFRRLISRERDGADVALSSVHRGYFYLHAFGSDAENVVGKHTGDFVMVLMRNQTTRDFGIRFRGEHRLGAFARIASPYTANVERGAATVSFERAVSLFTGKGFHADGFFVFLFVERNAGNHLPFRLRHFFYLIVKAGNGDSSVIVFHLADDFAEYVDGIGYRSAEMSGMKVAVRTGDLYLPISQSA